MKKLIKNWMVWFLWRNNIFYFLKCRFFRWFALCMCNKCVFRDNAKISDCEAHTIFEILFKLSGLIIWILGEIPLHISHLRAVYSPKRKNYPICDSTFEWFTLIFSISMGTFYSISELFYFWWVLPVVRQRVRIRVSY